MQRLGQVEELKQHAEAFEAELNDTAAVSLGVSRLSEVD